MQAEFIRFLRYAKRSCSEVQSELYLAMDNTYISKQEFDEVYEHARRTRAAIRGFINYLTRFNEKYKASELLETPAKYTPNYEEEPSTIEP